MTRSHRSKYSSLSPGNIGSKNVNTLVKEALVSDVQLNYPTLSPEYVTGLCEGEASFTYGRTPKGIRPRFAVKLHENDKGLIFALHAFFSVGSVYWYGARTPRPMAGKTGPSWQLCVTKRSELDVIVTHFDKHPLQGHKAEVYRIWRRIHELNSRNSDSNWGEIQTLASTMSGMVTKGRRSTKLVLTNG